MFAWKTFGALIIILFSISAILRTFPSSPKPETNPETKIINAIPQPIPEEIPITPEKPPLFHYIEIVDGCGPYFEDTCVNVRSGPGTEYEVVKRLRTGMVLKVAETVTVEGHDWHKIQFEETVRYKERITGDWYVSADFTRLFENEGDKNLEENNSSSTAKKIIIDRSDQTLSAYDGDTLFLQEKVSTGLDLTPTPRGNFVVYRKTPSRYMQGPLPGISDQYYDLPGVPWNLYFTKEGGAIHGAYWHDKFGQVWSHGCVNLFPEQAKKLYEWADVGTKVEVRD